MQMQHIFKFALGKRHCKYSTWLERAYN